ncbi:MULTISPECIES: AraC family transcriptional regulator [Paenibacillus]|uniref:AraC family transcriptional regulator n=1 Tax=Paenibacillus TaxID=44249 RepID=UPI00211711BF|nr:helix-turn-helix domain-containing protein [Paenibacillus odorifer]
MWNHALIEIIDIRHTFQRSGDLNSHYQLPSSAFLLIINGKAEILIDEVPHEISNFHILHGGKGMNIQFLRTEELLEYYLILYKANLSLASRNNLKAIMEHNNPFNLQYGFTPTSPLPLFDKMENMFTDWGKIGLLDRLHVKTLFYQWIYEMLRQLHTLETQLIQPDPLDQAIRYMQTYYKETFSLEKLAKAVNSSPRTLSRLFRTQLQTSPAQYLINIRMEKSKILLLNTEASLHDIAIAVGYPDGYYLGKCLKNITESPLSDTKIKLSPNPVGVICHLKVHKLTLPEHNLSVILIMIIIINITEKGNYQCLEMPNHHYCSPCYYALP